MHESEVHISSLEPGAFGTYNSFFIVRALRVVPFSGGRVDRLHFHFRFGEVKFVRVLVKVIVIRGKEGVFVSLTVHEQLEIALVRIVFENLLDLDRDLIFLGSLLV